MDRRLNVIEFHDCLHDYLPKRGAGTGTMEAKLAVQLGTWSSTHSMVSLST
ncbi:hypothetical protein ACHAWF_010999 [Thalassiosira exigua]